MQTFLPYPNFVHSAEVLDTKRLGKQRLECDQLLRALLDPDGTNGMSHALALASPRGWRNHPAARMWRGYESALGLYMTIVVWEWVSRGYANSYPTPYDKDFSPNPDSPHGASMKPLSEVTMPPWLGSPEFHASHRSNLLRKNPGWYGQFGWTEGPDLPYVWPSPEE